ncbi:MAG: signal peptidase I [SAR324 cluster bacterium]|nr:signal peptidase I [SAR324 cluster bacterium]
MDKLITHKATREWVEALIFAAVVAIVVRTFLFAPFRIPSGSMIPTIQIGDQIFATMFSYGIPVPLTDIKFFEEPVQRGDIVIFPAPPDPSIDFIKRTIALEGETIEIRDDKVYIDGKLLPEPYAFFDPENRSASQYPNVSNFGPVTVPKEHILTMGDNRYNSHDGRFWGFVPTKKVKGKGQMVYWSKDVREGITGFFEWDSYRFRRIFHFLEQ